MHSGEVSEQSGLLHGTTRITTETVVLADQLHLNAGVCGSVPTTEQGCDESAQSGPECFDMSL